jgi:hypothetical protein
VKPPEPVRAAEPIVKPPMDPEVEVIDPVKDPEVAVIAPVIVALLAVKAPAGVTLNVPEPLLYSIELIIPEVILAASRLAITADEIGLVAHDEPVHEYWATTIPAEYCHQMSPTFVPEPLGADVE